MGGRKANQSVQYALEAVAKKYGVHVEEINREMVAAINIAREEMDPRAQAFWRAIPHRGSTPTPEEVIAYLVEMERRNGG